MELGVTGKQPDGYAVGLVGQAGVRADFSLALQILC